MAITKTISPPVVNLTGNGIWYSLSSNLTDPSVSNLQIVIVVQYYNGSAWVDLQTATKPVIAGVAMFNVQHYLDKVPTPAFTFPESFDNLVITHEAACAHFRIKWKELYYNTTTNAYVSTTVVTDAETYWAIQGGIPEDVERLYNQAATSFYNELVLNKQFLTSAPRESMVCKKQTVKLYWLQRSDQTYLRLYVTKYFKNGTTSTVHLQGKDVAAYRIAELVCSPAVIFSDTEIDNVVKYDIFCRGSHMGIDISEIRTFTIDTKYYERNDFFAFQQSMGGFDCVWARGLKKESISIERNIYAKKLPYYADLTNRQLSTSRGFMSKKRVSEFGWFEDLELLEYLQEFFISENVVWLDNTIPWPVINISEAANLVDDSLNMQSLPFTWQPDVNSRFFHKHYLALRSPLPPYWEFLVAMFDRRIGNSLIDRISGLGAAIDSTGVTFPTLGTDVFNKTNATYWSGTIPNTAGNNRKWLFAELDWEFMVDYATETAHGTLFLKDFGTDVLSTLPIMVFSPARNETEQAAIVKYLDTYSFIVDESGKILTDKNNDYIVTGTI